jgi:SAM-dependent methyltransferase
MTKLFERLRRRGDRATSPKPAPAADGVVLENTGHCPTCAQDVKFVARNSWLRDHYLCSNCGSIPRERALMLTIEKHFPNWRELSIHESSPCGRGASVRLAKECKGYVASQFFPEVQRGQLVHGVRCEDLEQLTFHDSSIDLHVTQDVMEHVFNPVKAFRELARTLKPGGAHIFTTPLVRKYQPSRLRARIDEHGKVIHMEPPQYHGNPISEQGSLVTVDWGFDITRCIFDASGLFTHLIYIDDLSKGIRAEYIEVLATLKPKEGETLRLAL